MSTKIEEILQIIENKDEFQKLIQTRKNDYEKLQQEILLIINNVLEEYMDKKDGKSLLLILDRINKVLNELFTKRVLFKDGLSIVLESQVLMLKQLSQWPVTKNSCSLHKKWILIGGVFAEQKMLQRCIESMNEFLKILPVVQKTYPDSEFDYFEKTTVHAMFTKLQCFEDLKLLQQPPNSPLFQHFIESYKQWFQCRFEVVDKPNIYHDALFVKFYNRTVYILQRYKSPEDNLLPKDIRDSIILHCSFLAWSSLSKTFSPHRFFDRLLVFLLAVHKKNYYIEPNCWKILQDILNIIKSNLFSSMITQPTLDPLFIASLSVISNWAIELKNYQFLNELVDIQSEYIKSKKENREVIKYFQTEIIILQLYFWTNKTLVLANKIKQQKQQDDSNNPEMERELHKTLLMIHQLTEKALMNTEFLIDNTNSMLLVDSKFIYFKILGLLLQSLIEQGLMSTFKEKQFKIEISQQIQLFNQYYLLMPSLVIKWMQSFQQSQKLLPVNKMNPANVLYIDDFLKSYSYSLYEYFKRFQGVIPDDFKSQFNDINRDLLTISLEFCSGNGLEELSSFFYNIGTHFYKLTQPHDYQLAIFYLEGSIKLLDKSMLVIKSKPASNSPALVAANALAIEQHYESLSSSFFYLSQVYLKVKNYLKSHHYAVESIKSFLRDKKSFTEVIHNNTTSSKRRSIQEILRNLAFTQLHLFNQTQKTKSNYSDLLFINDIVSIDNKSFNLDFKIQLYDMALLNFTNIINEINGHQLLYIQIDKILNALPIESHPILHGRFLMEKAKVLRFYNPEQNDIESVFQQSIDFIKTTNLASDQPFESAIFNELAKVHFWRAITFVELHQNQCKDIIKYLSSDQEEQKLKSNTPYHHESESELFVYTSSTSICNFIKATDQNRFRSPIGSENSIISKEFKLSLNLWCKLLESLVKPPATATIPQQKSNSNEPYIIENLKSFISPHTTISLLYNMADIYSFEGDYVSSIFALKLVVGFVKCLFSCGSLCYLTEISKCYNLISSHFLELNNISKSKYYLELNERLIKSYQPILINEKLESFQLNYSIHSYELKYYLNPSDDTVCNEIINLYNQCLKQIETNYKSFDISIFMKISKTVSNIYVSQTNSAMAFVVSDKLIQCIFTAMPIESIDLLKEQKKELKQQQQQQPQTPNRQNQSPSSSSSTQPTKEMFSLLPVTSSKWASLKICLDSLLHISSIFELRGRPKEAQYYYERGLLIGIIYGSIKVTCEFLVEIGELFYSKQNYVDSKINLELVLFLISRHSSKTGVIEPSLQKPSILSNMLLGDLYRKQTIISKSKLHYKKSLSHIKNLYNDENQLLSKFNNLLNITNDSTPKEARLIKLLSSKSTAAAANSLVKSKSNLKQQLQQQQQQQQLMQQLEQDEQTNVIDQIIDSTAWDNKGFLNIEEIKNHLSSLELRIKGKIIKLLIAQKKYDSAIDSLEQLIQSRDSDPEHKYCNDITLSILEFHLGRAYYLSVDSDYKDKIWSRTISVNNFKVHPSISSARELLLRSFDRVGKYNLIKLNSLICKFLALTTGQLLPFVTCHFINLSIGIKAKHDMQSILHYQKSEKVMKNQDHLLSTKESLFSWNGGIDIPNQLGDITFTNKLKKIYSTDLPTDWSTCSLTFEDGHFIICKLVSNQIPILIRSKIPLLNNETNSNKLFSEEINKQEEEKEDCNDSKFIDKEDLEEEEEMEMELEEDCDSTDTEEFENVNYIKSSKAMSIVSSASNVKIESSYLNHGDNLSEESEEEKEIDEVGENLIYKYNILDKIRGNLKVIESENLFNNKENTPNDNGDSRKAWFYKRKTLEFEIGKVLSLVDSLFGPWKTLLIGSLVNQQVKERYEQTRDSLMEIINNQLFIESSNKKTKGIKKFDSVLFDCLFYGFPILSQRAITDGIIELMEYPTLDQNASTLDGHPNFQSIIEIYNLLSSECKKCYPSNTFSLFTSNSNQVLSTSPPTTPLANFSAPSMTEFLSQEKQPIVLIVDKYLHSIPFESMEPLGQLSLYRLPSFTFQRYLCYDQQSNSFSKKMPVIDPKSVFYLLNPNGGLKETEEYFSPYFKKKFPEWSGIIGQTPNKQQYKSALENHDIFFYMGHGSGEQYFRGDRIQKLEKCSVAVLMGCKSGHLEEQGEFEPTGVILDFLLAGSKGVIGNVFDVPTSDCDRLTKSFLNKWFLDLKKNECQPMSIDISLAISMARKSCEWKYLVGGSCIVYGIPIILKSFK
ncbi:hypothetical protein DICPUDRAFT_49103 [Dictyostelium purpureum]|uniref:separase n=1 Tax=Dictyostelium purpureum TaxID=5786 RepID=F0ZSA5_DICPU|nr:uncharacterized protein DICPUDRAFT_49103 [Dictyostelium purpureum]EGC33173.1 hypothetical protein DICPUDRAFT_49103 [Dictyostelium purpureum]|eukprot:XP_003290293.1 hypothetical protein DICPUDRAFT_49103 [Dictyostelium purpureum]